MFLTLTATAEKPVNASLTPDISVYPQPEVIEGLTLVFGAKRAKLLALGFVNGSLNESSDFLGFSQLLRQPQVYSGLLSTTTKRLPRL